MTDSQANLERALVELLPELEVLDRGLELEGAMADIVAIDREGRLVLLRRIDGEADAAILAAIDLLRTGRRDAGLIARHLDESRLDATRPPLVVLVAERFEPLQTARLEELGQERVLMLELREVQSARGATALLSTPKGSALVVPGPERAPDTFLDSLPDEQREIVDGLVTRLARLDPDLNVVVSGGGLEWRLQSTTICRVRRLAGGLMGDVESGPSFPLGDASGLDELLDAAMRRYVSVSDELTPAGPRPLEPKVKLSEEELAALAD